MTYNIRIVVDDEDERTHTARNMREIIRILSSHLEQVSGDAVLIDDEYAWLF